MIKMKKCYYRIALFKILDYNQCIHLKGGKGGAPFTLF